MRLIKNRAKKPLVDGPSLSRGWSRPDGQNRVFNIGIGTLGGDGGYYKLYISRKEAEVLRDWLNEELARPA